MCSVYNAVPAPSAVGDVVCTVGTNCGILRLDGRDNLTWLTGDPANHHKRGKNRRTPEDVLAQSFHTTNPNLLYAGTRASEVFLVDHRAPPVAWSCFRHASSVTHLRALRGSGPEGSNEHHVLVAGLRSSLCVYDSRYLKAHHPPRTIEEPLALSPRKRHQRGDDPNAEQAVPGPSEGKRQSTRRATPVTRPILTFPGYKNEAHVNIGLGVEEDVGVVAAAHDDGRVAIYSLQSGRRLRSPVVDAVKADTPIKSLQFQAMPRERHVSLWVGIEAALHKYSVGLAEDDEC